MVQCQILLSRARAVLAWAMAIYVVLIVAVSDLRQDNMLFERVPGMNRPVVRVSRTHWRECSGRLRALFERSKSWRVC